MPGCRVSHAEASRSHTKHEADDSDGGVNIFKPATSLNAVLPPKKSCLQTKTTGGFLTKIRKHLSKKRSVKKNKFATEPTSVSYKEDLEEDYDSFEKNEIRRQTEISVGQADPLRQEQLSLN
jgi:hypothetical protein